ncbi:hypothetical protein ACC764_28465 [Rhizobium ruizarguesonis]|uniref:hypothetical protein n=1 Tax=Rhizobium ruizarguesonis TaxID=2081791 RepID=UPI00102F378B|nr:hypothetical protein [Rhizobium ruizarguesonis]TAZ93618.1 hypothetical protein ELH67_03085 [Rhizobium ruizarguesonis]TBA36516.1 hypothetical protein ELH60_03085 [Rhizobium ruizarguesonis]TBC61845.1 hypothetical protein ELH36_03080 [Rhizobium ruizarguesonis]WSH21806.1 hypothetical protein U8Q07_05295 [Rhizobium ruizarguesonis]WSH34723.1 hypothetical protein U8P70_05290 [Rhizobium ruizarguesonis]
MLKAMLKNRHGGRPAERQMPADVANTTDIDIRQPTSLRNGSLRHVAIEDNCRESRARWSTGMGCFKPCRILSSISKPMSHYNQAAAMLGD